MIEWARRIIIPHFDDEELNRRAFNLNIVLAVTFVVMLLGIVAMSLQIGKRPLSYMLPNMTFIILAALILVFCYYLSRKGRVQAGSIIFVTMMTIACSGAIIVGGTQGALGVILIIPIAAASTTLGGNASLGLATLGVTTLVAVGVLERNGIIRIAYPAPEMTILLNMFDIGFSLFFVTLSIWLASYSLRQSLERTQQAVVEANRYRQQLEQSLAAEQTIRDRLQRGISKYAAFLDRIGQGDYAARLSLTEKDKDLAVLEQQINAMVDALVAAVEQAEAARREVEAAQRRYVLQEWRHYVRSKAATDFEAARPGAELRIEEPPPAVREALTQRRTVTSTYRDSQENEAGAYSAIVTPIMLRGEIVGALRLHREAGERAWTDDERELVEAVAERLALAAETMRLFEHTQLRAARERVLSQMTARFTHSLDMDAVLQAAVRELGGLPNTAEVSVYLTPPEEPSPANEGEGADRA
jgi:GAF domain-containing protein